MNALDIKVLPFSSKARICWGFFWRGIVISIGSAVCGAVLGFIVGFVLGFVGMAGAATVIGGLLGAVVGVYFIYVYLLWILGSRIGNFRVVLVEAGE